MFGRKTAIRTVDVPVDTDNPDEPLMHLIEHFPSVKRTVRLDMHYHRSILPTDAALHRFERLETIVMDTWCGWEWPSFWSDLCAIKAFRRVSNFITLDDDREYLEEADAGALFDFITDFSLMPAGKTRVVKLGRPFTEDSFKALKRRFKENIASIGGHVCAVIFDDYADKHHLTNMTSGRQKKTLAKKLLRAAYKVKP
ncbi:hypothetical protein AAVH_25618 [Aphelenchoides avenae]|nr:hypothetical protein AAVH_25618 [Aphelenchus avenae]